MPINNWTDIAQHIKLIYDNDFNYNPQYEEYTRGTVIKQADTILIGYPLLYQLNDTIKRNNLKYYESVIRTSGPAMTWSMHAINNLDLNENVHADVMFRKSYQQYIRPPFNVRHLLINYYYPSSLLKRKRKKSLIEINSSKKIHMLGIRLR